MLYLLDANVLIDANRDYYSIPRVPEFWDWLVHHGAHGVVKIPVEFYEELKVGNDDLALWAREETVRATLLLDEEPDVALVSRAVEDGYAPDLTDDEIERLGRDPFIIAYALASPVDRCVVTTERSKPSRQRANRHLPDVCRDLGVACCDSFTFFRVLDFSTGWR